MATTTATVSISSSDLMPGSPLSITANTVLTKAGVTTGLTQIEIEPQGGTNTIEYAFFNSDFILTTAA